MTKEPVCLVWVSGKQLTPMAMRKVLGLSLSMSEKKASSGTLVFQDTDLSVFDSRLFDKNRSLAFMLGWTDNLSMFGPFYIKSVSLSCPESGDVRFTVNFQDKTHKMNKQQKRKKHVGTPKSILIRLAKKHKLQYDIDDLNEVTYTDDFPLMQANMTDAALIRQLATTFGYVWGVEGNTLFFRKPEEAAEDTGRQVSVPVLSYKMNDYSLMSFTPEIKYLHKGHRQGSPTVAPNSDPDAEGGENPDALPGDEQVKADLLKLKEMMEKGITSTDAFTAGSMWETVKMLANPFYEPPVMNNETTFETGAPDAPQVSMAPVKTKEGPGESLLPWEKQAQAQTIHRDPELYTNDEAIAEEIDGYYLSEVRDANGDLDIYLTDIDVSTDLELDDRAFDPDVEFMCIPFFSGTGTARKKTEIIMATATPSIASVGYLPGKSIIFAGLGKRLSGKYRITDCDMSIVQSSNIFSQTLKVTNRGRLRNAAVDKKLNDPDSPKSSAEGTPEQVAKKEAKKIIDEIDRGFGDMLGEGLDALKGAFE